MRFLLLAILTISSLSAGVLNSVSCKNARVVVDGFTGTLNAQAIVKVNQPSGVFKLFKKKITTIIWNSPNGSATGSLDPHSTDTFSIVASRPSWITSVTIQNIKYAVACN